MNKITGILFVISVFCSNRLFSQDSLFIKESETLLVRVLEISARSGVGLDALIAALGLAIPAAR